MENKQKSVEDYRNIIKLLKLKVMKLQKKNQELEQKLYEPLDESYISGNSQQDIQAGKIQTAWRNKNQVDPANQTEGILMQDLYKGCRKIGITTEGLYRAADKDSVKVIPTEEFKFFLKNCRLQITQGQVNRLAAMADEECCGKVTEQNWHNLLEMYEVSQETKSTNTRSFAQKSLFMLANLFVEKKISPEQGFNEVAKGHTTITSERFKSYCLNADKNMSERHCSSAFNHLDFNKKGRISKEFFTGEVRKAMRILASEKGLTISQFCPPQEDVVSRPQQQQPQQQQQIQSSPSKPVNNNSLLPGNNQRINMMSSSRKPMSQSQLDQTVVVPEFQVDKANAAIVIKSLQSQGIDIGKLFQAMLDELTNPKAGIRIKDVFNAFNNVQNGNKISKNLQLEFFKCLDTNCNGGADFNEALDFYCYYMDTEKEDSWPLELVYGMKKCHLDATLTTIDEYLEQFQITHETDLNEKTFKYQAKRMFNIKKEKKKVMEKVAHKVQGKGNINNALRNAKISKKKKIIKKEKKQLPVDLDEFGKNLAKVREQQGKDYELGPDDFFTKFKLEQDTSGQAIEKPWSTILNDETACLIKCMEIIKELKAKKLEKWTDPEFGPNDNDKVGASALYFTDNDIPDGAPKPEDVIWMRPEELLQTLRDMGTTFKTGELDKDGNDVEQDYEDKEPLFLEGGASSNDVQQSQYLGDCWFISALSIIAQDDNLIDGAFDPDPQKIKDISDKEAKGMASGVYPPMFHFMEQYGVYVMRFFKNAGWRYVIVDDRIPCKEGGEIVYGQCKQKNELWVPIIEKAFAKIHNSYQALIAGDIAQGLADMTGMIADKTKLNFQNLRTKPEDEMTEDELAKQKEDLKKEAEEADQLWEKLKEAKRNQTMMGCSAEGATEGFIDIDGENSGVMSGHAYSLLDVIELPYLDEEKASKKGRGFHRLLRIRNPWGHGEWKFKWSDTGEEYKEQTLKHKKDIDNYYEQERKKAEQWNREHPNEDPLDLNEFESIELGVDDGTFLMNFKEWRQLYANLFQCINFPDDWSGKRIQGEWKDKLNFGPPTKTGMEQYALENPQYIFDIKRTSQKGIKDKKTTQVYINLTQRDGRMFWGEKYPYDRVTTYMLLCVFKLDEGEQQLTKFDKRKCDAGGSSKSLILRREVDSDFMDLPDGKYAIIPCAKKRGYIGTFTLNIYFDCHENDIKFRGANEIECEALDIAEESEEITHISDEKRWIYQDLAGKELEMVTERRKKYGNKK